MIIEVIDKIIYSVLVDAVCPDFDVLVYRASRISHHAVYCLLYRSLLNLFRRIYSSLGMIDISPIFAFISLGLIEAAVKWIAARLFL